MSVEFLSPSYQTKSPTLCKRACKNLELYRRYRQNLINTHLDNILKELERIILKESLYNGKDFIDFDVSSFPFIDANNSSDKPDKLNDYELNNILNFVIKWLIKEELSVKQHFEKSSCMNLRTKITISWKLNNSNSNSDYNNNDNCSLAVFPAV